MKTVKLDIRLSVEEKEALYARAKGKGISVSEYVRNWINEEIPADDGSIMKPEDRVGYVERNDKDNKVREAIAKAEKIEKEWSGPMFKRDKLNKF
jgi:stringent starvation protein B